MPSYLNVYLHFPKKISFIVSSLNTCSLIVFTLIFGYLFENFNKKKCILFSASSMAILLIPLGFAMFYKSLFFICITLFLCGISLASIDAIIMSFMGSAFETNARCSGISISFSFAIAIFGGTAPTICSYIINSTGDTLSPIFFLLFACIMGIIGGFIKQKNPIPPQVDRHQ